jgi:REP element-mobilizing transposase RayT
MRHYEAMRRAQGPPQPEDNYRLEVQGATPPRFGTVKIRDRGRLPHWEKEAGLYFVTYHLGDALPRSVLAKIAARRSLLQEAQRSGRSLLPQEKAALAEVSRKKIEEYLDAGGGACYLRDPRIAELVANALRYWEAKKYRLLAWCVMPNHVHVVFRLFPAQVLADILRSWKSYTSRMANRLLGRRGEFWEREYYDHLIRNGKELDRAIKYVMSNPERAGLKGWRWCWCAGVDALTTAGLEASAT